MEKLDFYQTAMGLINAETKKLDDFCDALNNNKLEKKAKITVHYFGNVNAFLCLYLWLWHYPEVARIIQTANFFFFKACSTFFYWSLGLQCCVSFKCTAKWFNCVCVCVLFPYRLLQNIWSHISYFIITHAMLG